MEISLQDRVVFITQTPYPLGAALVRTFSAAGAQVAIQPEGAWPNNAEIPADTLVLSVGYSHAEALRAGVARVEAHFGGLDILINCATPSIEADFLDIQPETWTRQLEKNLSRPFWATQAAGRKIAARGGGLILHIFGDNGDSQAIIGGSLSMLTQVSARILATDQIRVNAVFAPHVSHPDRAEGVITATVEAALFLAQNDFITGAVLNADTDTDQANFLSNGAVN